MHLSIGASTFTPSTWVAAKDGAAAIPHYYQTLSACYMRYLPFLLLIPLSAAASKAKAYVPPDHFDFTYTYAPADLAALSMLAYKESKARASQPVLAMKEKVNLFILLLLGFEVLFYFSNLWMSKLDYYLGLGLASKLNSQATIQPPVFVGAILSYFIICYCLKVLLSYDKKNGFISEGEVRSIQKKGQ